MRVIEPSAFNTKEGTEISKNYLAIIISVNEEVDMP